MVNQSKLWIGSINGIHGIYDPSLQVEGTRWVLLFIINRNNLVPYRRLHARSLATTHSSSHPLYEQNLKVYKTWRDSQKPEQINVFRKDVLRMESAANFEASRIEYLHKTYLSGTNLKYPGISEPTTADNIRDTICFKCHGKISSHLNPRCNACGWLVCASCGTCGCRLPTLELDII